MKVFTFANKEQGRSWFEGLEFFIKTTKTSRVKLLYVDTGEELILDIDEIRKAYSIN